MVFEKDGFKVISDLDTKVQVKVLSDEDHVKCTLVEFTFDKVNETEERKLIVEHSFVATDIAGRWHPCAAADRSVKPDWFDGTASMAAISAPIICYFNADSQNRRTIALSEIKQKAVMKYGVHEEDGTMQCHTEVMLPIGYAKDTYELKIWESTEDGPYWEAIAKAAKWWEEELNLPIMEVPDIARDTMYSFWYSQHQEVSAQSVEAESALAAKLGFTSVIVDDGWQTDDHSRGYSTCGDWEPCEAKFPDMAAHIKKVQDMGLKYLMWFSVPFLGKKSKAWETFKDKTLCFDDFQKAAVLDLRYPEVREHLKAVYRKAVKEWGLDGLKLDFIDEVYLRPESPVYKEGMDYADIQDALDAFLTEVMEELRAIRPDIMIEFRQKYIGPQIRKYGNLLRVIDCPMSGLSNRVGTIDLRMLSGNTAVHADMLMWNENEKPEDAALQVISCIFSTAQISVDLSKITPEMETMLRFWMKFMKNHKMLLQTAQIQPLEPENLYPQVMVEDEDTRIQVCYSKGRIVNLKEIPKTFYYVHGTKEEDVVFCMKDGQNINWEVVDCMGTVLESGKWMNERFGEIKVPTSGMVKIEMI